MFTLEWDLAPCDYSPLFSSLPLSLATSPLNPAIRSYLLVDYRSTSTIFFLESSVPGRDCALQHRAVLLDSRLRGSLGLRGFHYDAVALITAYTHRGSRCSSCSSKTGFNKAYCKHRYMKRLNAATSTEALRGL